MLWLGQFRSSWWHFNCRVLTYFGHLMWRTDSLEKTLILGKVESQRRTGWQRMNWLDSITDSMYMNLSKLWEIVKDRGAWCADVHGVTKSQTWFSDWTTTIYIYMYSSNILNCLSAFEMREILIAVYFKMQGQSVYQYQKKQAGTALL